MSTPLHPEITWAQRSNPTDPAKNILFVGIVTPDVSQQDAELKITPTSVKLNAKSNKGVEYAVDLELFDEIVPEESKQKHTSRGFDLVLRKKEAKEEYWPRLLKEKKKVHFLKTDFDKWVDEDEQDEAPEDDMSGFDMNALQGMGGGMGGGMPGMGGMGDMGGAGGLDFSKLGGMEGMDMSALQNMAAGMGGDDAGEEDGEEAHELEANEKVPEEATEKAAEAKEGEAKKKIEEIE
ncbi:hypothetical protein KEM56_004238 [Ascosphaera pollenicola]|nr:hypothetical protein KEM56_004238 [Ascosphaera pollenicola]